MALHAYLGIKKVQKKMCMILVDVNEEFLCKSFPCSTTFNIKYKMYVYLYQKKDCVRNCDCVFMWGCVVSIVICLDECVCVS